MLLILYSVLTSELIHALIDTLLFILYSITWKNHSVNHFIIQCIVDPLTPLRTLYESSTHSQKSGAPKHEGPLWLYRANPGSTVAYAVVVFVVKVVKVVLRFEYKGSGTVIRVFQHGLVTVMRGNQKILHTHTRPYSGVWSSILYAQSLQRGRHSITYRVYSCEAHERSRSSIFGNLHSLTNSCIVLQCTLCLKRYTSYGQHFILYYQYYLQHMVAQCYCYINGTQNRLQRQWTRIEQYKNSSVQTHTNYKQSITQQGSYGMSRTNLNLKPYVGPPYSYSCRVNGVLVRASAFDREHLEAQYKGKRLTHIRLVKEQS